MKKKILIVEDEDIIRKDLVRTLELSDFEVYSSTNGKLALEIARQKNPDLIISDIMMPEIDGYEFLTQVQQIKEIADTPFLFLSAKSDKSDIREGMNLGADDFITKPFDIDELLNVIETRLKKKEISREKFNQKFESLRTNIRQNLPHEIRTPLSVIIGYTDLMLNKLGDLDKKEIRDMLNNIKTSTKRLNSLFENYLLYANLEIIAANTTDIEKLRKGRTVAPESIIKSVIDYESASHKRSKDIIVKIDEGMIAVSEQYFMKAFEEIFINAMKFSSPGTIIEVSAVSGPKSYNVFVKDYGRGMTSTQIEDIGAYVQFERKVFEQQGSGLGLAITRRILELHGGSFRITSEPDKFTLVEIELPLLV